MDVVGRFPSRHWPLVLVSSVALLSAPAFAQTSGTPVPRPFPGSVAPSGPTGAQPSAPPAAQQAPAVTPPAAAGPVPVPSGPTPVPPGSNGPDLGDIPLYPTAVFLDSYDAGSGQRYYLYGVPAEFSAVVGFYKSVLRNGGREIYKQPGVQQFELGRFRDDRMAYPPSVVVKDYAWNNSPGYLHVSGTDAVRYPTVVQIVPPPPSDNR